VFLSLYKKCSVYNFEVCHPHCVCGNWKGYVVKHTCVHLIFIGLCVIVIVENKRPTWCHLLFLFHFLCAQHVSDINISIIRSLRLFCWITTLVVRSWCFGVVGLAWYLCCWLQLQVIQQNSRKLLMIDLLMSETCWAHKKWNKNSKWHQVGLLFSTTMSINLQTMSINLQMPNVNYSGRTAPLTSKVAFYIYLFNKYFSSKCSLFHNSNMFGSCIIHILYTGCAKIKKIIPAPKG